jgi:hypothetical protein
MCAKMFLWTKMEQMQIILKTTTKSGSALIHWKSARVTPEEEIAWNNLMSEHHYLGFRALLARPLNMLPYWRGNGSLLLAGDLLP